MVVEGLIIPSAHEVQVQEMVVPDPDASQIVVRVRACGLCTWEQRVYRGHKRTYPFWGGHEVCGVVENVGDNVQHGVRTGDLVALALMNRCGSCEWCRRGLDNHCAYVFPSELNGLPVGPKGLSTHIAVPEQQVIVLEPFVGPHRGALLEPLACTLRSIRRSGLQAGDLAVVIGSGTFGKLHVATLMRMGVNTFCCTPRNRFEKLGQREEGPGSRDVVAVIEKAGGAAAVFCTSGGGEWIKAAIRMCRRGGTVILFQSISDGDDVTFSANDVHYREIKILGSVSQRLEDFLQAKKMVERHPDLFESLKLTSFPYHEPRAAFDRSLAHDVNRVLVTFSV